VNIFRRHFLKLRISSHALLSIALVADSCCNNKNHRISKSSSRKIIAIFFARKNLLHFRTSVTQLLWKQRAILLKTTHSAKYLQRKNNTVPRNNGLKLWKHQVSEVPNRHNQMLWPRWVLETIRTAIFLS
jgi:hypothetical protein